MQKTLIICCLSILLTFLFLMPAQAAILKVGSTLWADYGTIQAAVDAAAADDEIWVMEGDYVLSNEISINKAISIFGGFAGFETSREQRDWQSNITTIDGNSTVRCLNISSNALINGFNVKNGYSQHQGGAVYIIDAAPNFEHCNFMNNSSDGSGGAIYNSGFNCADSPEISDCTFQWNGAIHYGGAIFNSSSSPSILNCVFTNNGTTNTDMGYGGSSGGAIYSETRSAPVIVGCTFSFNSVNVYGGAIYINGWGASDPTIISNCIFTNNTSQFCGGALFNIHFFGVVSNCVFTSNLAALKGGAMHNADAEGTHIVNCTIKDNTSGYGTELYNSDISDTTLTITNTIIRNDAPSQVIVNAYGSPLVGNCNITGSGGSSNWDDSFGIDGGANIDQMPLFVSSEDLHLETGSPCIDTGDNTTEYLPATDLDGNNRIQDGDGDGDGDAIVDMGAFEFLSANCENDLDQDNDVDGADLALFIVMVGDIESFALSFGRTEKKKKIRDNRHYII
ncbi:MAG: hypothetical protein GY729_05740, partial [Desulfobacteraceae bacterium]|nr:hypothetical protein [Desulfobacteraceae bacterium]